MKYILVMDKGENTPRNQCPTVFDSVMDAYQEMRVQIDYMSGSGDVETHQFKDGKIVFYRWIETDAGEDGNGWMTWVRHVHIKARLWMEEFPNGHGAGVAVKGDE